MTVISEILVFLLSGHVKMTVKVSPTLTKISFFKTINIFLDS